MEIGKPFEWNVVVVGAWNLSILTPRGIGRKLFQVAANTPMEIKVPIDRKASISVTHSDVTVIPSESRLEIMPVTPNPNLLVDAANIAIKAVDWLSETPMKAAGINVKYKFKSLPDDFITVLNSTLDDKLTDCPLSTRERGLTRTVDWEPGVININIQEHKDTSGTVTFNFHRQSESVDELKEWINKTKEMREKVATLLASIFNYNVGGEDE